MRSRRTYTVRDTGARSKAQQQQQDGAAENLQRRTVNDGLRSGTTIRRSGSFRATRGGRRRKGCEVDVVSSVRRKKGEATDGAVAASCRGGARQDDMGAGRDQDQATAGSIAKAQSKQRRRARSQKAVRRAKGKNQGEKRRLTPEKERERLPGELRAAGLIVAPSAPTDWLGGYMAVVAEPVGRWRPGRGEAQRREEEKPSTKVRKKQMTRQLKRKR